MKKLFIVANWKSNKTTFEAIQWLKKFTVASSQLTDKEIIICASFTLLPDMKKTITELKLPIKLGAQDVSPYDEGAYTGGVNGKQIKEFADYVLIGHIERREKFGEDDGVLEKKVTMAIKYDITPIFCIQKENSFIPATVKIVAYDPAFAIGTGKPDTAENANKIAHQVKTNGIDFVIYGGSVTSENVNNYTQASHLDGVLPGKASLDPAEF